VSLMQISVNLAGKHPTELFESDALEDCGTTISL